MRRPTNQRLPQRQRHPACQRRGAGVARSGAMTAGARSVRTHTIYPHDYPATCLVSSPPACPRGGLLGARLSANGARRLCHCCTRGLGRNSISDANFTIVAGERAVAESLQAWQRCARFTMLAVSYDDVIRRRHAFCGWRGTWDHIMTCRKALRQTCWNCLQRALVARAGHAATGPGAMCWRGGRRSRSQSAGARGSERMAAQ